MFGLDDPYVLIAFLGCFIATLVSLLYGLVRHRAARDEPSDEDRAWAREDSTLQEQEHL